MTLPKLNPLDQRLNVYSPQLADKNLEGSVSADRFVDGSPAQVCVSAANLYKAPNSVTAIEAQILFGQTVRVFDQNNSMAWLQVDHNNYVGWVEQKALSSAITTPTHHVKVPRTFLYPQPDMKRKACGQLSMGSFVEVTSTHRERGTDYSILKSGESLISGHLLTIGRYEPDYVAVAESLLHIPYLWGGDSGFGLDCSGLVQLSMAMAGKQVLRDSDMQAATTGEIISPGSDYSNLKRGDLVFWKGHVAIVRGDGAIIHANGHTMTVAIEPLARAIDRIAYLYDKPIGYRRP